MFISFYLFVFLNFLYRHSSSQRVAIIQGAEAAAVRVRKVRWSPSPPGPMQRRRRRRGRRRIIITVTSDHHQRWIHPLLQQRQEQEGHRVIATAGSHRSSWAALDGVRRASQTPRRANDARRPTRRSTSRYKRTNKSTGPLIGSSFSVLSRLSSHPLPQVPFSNDQSAAHTDTQTAAAAVTQLFTLGFTLLVCPLIYRRLLKAAAALW